MTAGLAALPMYDWPELRPATDWLWQGLRDALRRAGIEAPDTLTRDRPAAEVWHDPHLVLAQTCGLPFVRTLCDRVTLVGTPDYGVPGCAPGWYRSAVVTRDGDTRAALGAFRDARVALNGRDSQSGYAALLHHVAQVAEARRFFADTVVTGSHAASIRAVASGRADIAAIDFVTWRIARRFLPEALALRVLMLTEPTPGLPFVTAAPGTDLTWIRTAVAAGIANLDDQTRADLGVTGFAPLDASDYALVNDRATAAEARVAL